MTDEDQNTDSNLDSGPAPDANGRATGFKAKWQELAPWQRKLSIVVSAFVGGLLLIYLLIFAGLPDAEDIKNYQPQSTVKAGSVNWGKTPSEPVRIWAPLKQISPLLQKAVIVSEDDQFYQHDGVNLMMMWEAFKVNWERKRYVRGASTITMQLARNAFLTKHKTILRKIREIIVARRLEENLSKARILESYLNLVEWGENIYGVEAASQRYFGKPAANLTLAQASLLASMLPNPIYFDPFKRPQSCKRMQKRVLWLMKISRYITAEQSQMAFASSFYLRGHIPPAEPAPIDESEEAFYAISDTVEPLQYLSMETVTPGSAVSRRDTTEADSLAQSTVSPAVDTVAEVVADTLAPAPPDSALE